MCHKTLDNLVLEDVLKGATISDIANKYHLNVNEVAQRFFSEEQSFKIDDDRVFNLRLKRGAIRIGEDCIEKLCPRCNEYWPLTKEYYHSNCRTKDGAFTHCRSCEMARKQGLNEDIAFMNACLNQAVH